MKTFYKKRKVYWPVVIALHLCMAAFCLSGCGEQKKEIVPGNKEMTVFVASDLHLYSNNLLSEENVKYRKENFATDGRVQEWDYQLVEALVDAVNESAPDYLVLTGDLSYNGEKDSHLELVRLLGEIEKTKVLVIPGNHDLYSQDAFSALEDKAKGIHGIDEEKFREIYAAYGYEGAYSYDTYSLSYIYEMGEKQWALMLDTTLCRYNEDNGFNVVGGYLEEPTLRWLEEHLQYAKENGISVVSFTHHNLLVHNALFQSRYTLSNYEEVLDLYGKYDVTLNFSGHLHIQSIQSARENGNTIYDVSAGSLLDYGNRYGRLDIYDNCFSYTSHTLGISDYPFQVFKDKYYAKIVKQYKNALGEENGEAAARLLSEINAYYFDGDYVQIQELLQNNKSLIRAIKKNTANYETSYVHSIINVTKDNQHSLLIEN